MQSESSEIAIWQYVHCSVCMVLFLPPNRPDPVPDMPFWVTDCGHVICNNHLKADQSCAACGTVGISCVALQPRNMNSSIYQWFTPVSESHEKLAVAASVQYNMLTELIEHYKKKYGAAKAMIMRLQDEVRSLQQQLEFQQNHQPASHLPFDQRPIHDSGYSSGPSSGSKRRRIDTGANYHVGQGGGSSPRSVHTPIIPSRFGLASGAGNSMMRKTGDSMVNSSTAYNQPTSHRIPGGQAQGGGQLRSLNAQKYAYIPPSTPMNGSTPNRTTQQQVPPRSAAMMPPPAIYNRQLGSSSVLPAAPNLPAPGQSISRLGQPKSSVSNPAAQGFTGRLQSGSAAQTPRPALQKPFQNRMLSGASSNRTSSFPNVGDGRRFVPGTPIGPKSSAGGGQLFAGQTRR